MTQPLTNWAVAFAKQARSDLHAYDVLCADSELPACHRLHYLQMACEKTCKANLIEGGTDIADIETSHAYIENTMGVIAKEFFARQRKRHTWEINAIKRLARQIELLSPAVKDGGRVPSNCEYPWEDAAGQILIPAEYNFELELLHQRTIGPTFIKLLRLTIADVLGETND